MHETMGLSAYFLTAVSHKYLRITTSFYSIDVSIGLLPCRIYNSEWYQ